MPVRLSVRWEPAGFFFCPMMPLTNKTRGVYWCIVILASNVEKPGLDENTFHR